LLATDLPRLALPRPAAGEVVDPRRLFPRPVSDVWLEIGFGAGEHLIGQALARPDVGFIGCEPYLNGVAALLAGTAGRGLDTIRVFADDARLLLPHLPDASIGRIFLLFADPWPKRRHHRRRFVGAASMRDLARILVDDGELWFASDHADYVRWTLWHALCHPEFAWDVRRPNDWRSPPADWIETRYQAKAARRGERCFYLRFRRQDRVGGPEPERKLLVHLAAADI
jgi:tRNA (guanine-N7-)-methyltransferase